jgi:hypothetical protein
VTPELRPIVSPGITSSGHGAGVPQSESWGTFVAEKAQGIRL